MYRTDDIGVMIMKQSMKIIKMHIVVYARRQDEYLKMWAYILRNKGQGDKNYIIEAWKMQRLAGLHLLVRLTLNTVINPTSLILLGPLATT